MGASSVIGTQSSTPPLHHSAETQTPQVMRHRNAQQRHIITVGPVVRKPSRLPSLDDADVAAGMEKGAEVVETVWLVAEPVTAPPISLFGFDISHLSRRSQFKLCACGVFMFSLLYGYLQELISIHIFNRRLGLFLSSLQFSGYSFWSYFLRNFAERRKEQNYASKHPPTKRVPLEIYIGISLLRAVDLCMTNMAMRFVNYPAKTLMKSSRVCWTMLFGFLIAGKRYGRKDYLIVAMMAAGLAVFMHADSRSSAVFQPLGVFMLITSLMCDGALTNMSESVMSKYHLGQDEYIFAIYSIALCAITAAAAMNGELFEGLRFLFSPGTYDEFLSYSTPTWSVSQKLFVITSFSTLGFLASSCSAAITKNFGALTMSITSTARKATTLFLSFALFPNECTYEHISGIILFIVALVLKSSKTGKKRHRKEGAISVSLDETATEKEIRMVNDSGYHIV